MDLLTVASTGSDDRKRCCWCKSFRF